MEESPFDRAVFNESINILDSAFKSDQNEAWVYLAYSLAVMQQGYKIGSWYELESFDGRAIDKALEFATKANELGRDVSQTYAHLALVYIIKSEYKQAWEFLNKAHQIDKDNYYVWLYKSLIYYYMRDYEHALLTLENAEMLVQHKYHNKFITREKQRIARKTGNKELEESMYKKNIENFPDNAYMYGNYGAFLYRNKRYAEAVEYYSKAVSIKSYPNAVEWLEKSKTMAGIK